MSPICQGFIELRSVRFTRHLNSALQDCLQNVSLLPRSWILGGHREDSETQLQPIVSLSTGSVNVWHIQFGAPVTFLWTYTFNSSSKACESHGRHVMFYVLPAKFVNQATSCFLSDTLGGKTIAYTHVSRIEVSDTQSLNEAYLFILCLECPESKRWIVMLPTTIFPHGEAAVVCSAWPWREQFARHARITFQLLLLPSTGQPQGSRSLRC